MDQQMFPLTGILKHWSTGIIDSESNLSYIAIKDLNLTCYMHILLTCFMENPDQTILSIFQNWS